MDEDERQHAEASEDEDKAEDAAEDGTPEGQPWAKFSSGRDPDQ